MLADVTEQPVTVADLFAGDGLAQITARASLPLHDLRAVLTGAPVAFKADDVDGLVDDLSASYTRGLDQLRGFEIRDRREFIDVLRDFSESHGKVAKSLGVDRVTAAQHMANLWGKTFRAGRDTSAGPDANAQRKGRVARQLKAQLRDEIERRR